MIVAIEGIDSSGKDSLTAEISARLMADGIAHTSEHFPRYDTPLGAEIADRLRDGRVVTDPLGFQAVATTGFYDWAATAPPGTCILNRYWGSAVAYGGASGLAHDWLLRVHSSLPRPALWIYVDAEPETAARRRTNHDTYEENLMFQAEVRRRYLDGVGSWMSPCVAVPAGLSPAEVADRVWPSVRAAVRFGR